MKAKLFLMLATVALLCAGCCNGKKTVLFNGRDLTGWVGYVDDATDIPSDVVYTVNDGKICIAGMPFGYLVSGNLSEEENLRMIIEARAQVGGNFLAGVATDENNPDAEIDRLAETLNYAIENKYVPPQNFYGIGGMKIFRDLIWQMQGMMKADHKFYKSHGQYDFPQKKWPRMLAMYAVGAMIGNPKIKAKMGNKMNEGMLMPYKKLLDKTEKK